MPQGGDEREGGREGCIYIYIYI
jgi:hypothetical protein